MINVSDEKWNSLPKVNDRLNERYGVPGTPSRERKRQKLTQQQLADKIGKKREYISTIERGNSDMQMSTFLQIASALGLRFSLVVG